MERQSNSEKDIKVLNTQMDKQMNNSAENTKIILKSNQALTKTLVDLNTERDKSIPDPNNTHQKQKLYEEVQRGNCVLTNSNCTETLDG